MEIRNTPMIPALGVGKQEDTELEREGARGEEGRGKERERMM
jgi:hypothetical protein